MNAISQTRIRVRYAETDQMGVVYHANFFVWFEIGRVELLRQTGLTYKQMEREREIHLPVVDASCRYKSPARYDDELLLETRVLLMRGSLLRFGYRLLCPETELGTLRLLAEGETTHVVVNARMQKTPLPEEYASALKGFLAESDGGVEAGAKGIAKERVGE